MRILSVLLLSISPLFAVPYRVMTSYPGTFNGSTPVTPLTFPHRSWSFSFLIDSNPVPLSVDSPNSATFAISEFQYRLNGLLVGLYIDTVTLFTDAGSGGFRASPLIFYSPQLFSGPISSPTMLSGVVTALPESTINNVQIGIGTDLLSGVAVPEPASVGLALFGLLSLGLLRRRTRK